MEETMQRRGLGVERVADCETVTIAEWQEEPGT